MRREEWRVECWILLWYSNNIHVNSRSIGQEKVDRLSKRWDEQDKTVFSTDMTADRGKWIKKIYSADHTTVELRQENDDVDDAINVE